MSVVFSLVSAALIAGGVFALLGWNMHRAAIHTRPVRQVYAWERYVTIDDLPEFYVNVVTAVKDRDFWGHVGIVRALLHDIKAGSFAEGGSTITMQCAVLAGLPQAPSVYSPDVAPELA